MYVMAWTVLAGWRCSLDFAGVLMIWNRSDMHLTSGEIQRRSCSRSVKSSAHGRRWLCVQRRSLQQKTSRYPCAVPDKIELVC